jgi:hypothetical protein
MQTIPFSKTKQDETFLEGRELLSVMGSPLTEDEVFEVYKAVLRHVELMTAEVTGWWKRLGYDDTIDVSHPSTSFYNVVLSKCRLAIKNMSKGMARKAASLLADERSDDVKKAESLFFNLMIRDMKADPLLRLAC